MQPSTRVSRAGPIWSSTLGPSSRQEVKKMFAKEAQTGHVIAAMLGAAAGGLVVIAVTKAIPKMMSRMMSDMMGTMIAQMGEAGCSPAEI